MKLENGYSVIYEARDRQESEQAHGPFFAAKGNPALDDAMLISYDNAGQYVDLSTIKLLYSDGKHLLGSVSGKPAADDINIIFKTVDGEIVFGEVIEEVVEAPKVKKSRAKKPEVVVEPEEPKEEVQEEPAVEEA